MLEKCRTASQEFSELDVLNAENVRSVLEKNDSLLTTRTIVTDASGNAIFDTESPMNDATDYQNFTEINSALNGMDVVYWKYDDGIMISKSAAPIVSYVGLTGCVYMMEEDAAQGQLLSSLQWNIFTITGVLEIIVIIISVFTAYIYSGKIRRFLSSMRIIREGDYSHKLCLRGKDELNLLADAFNQLTDRLQVSENKRRQFVSDASHELKTPLASIKLLSDSILQNDVDMATVKEFVSDIGNEADRLNRMSQKLLSLSKIESDMENDWEIVQVKPTIERVVRMLAGIAGKNEIHIITELQDNCPVLIQEDDLYQIIFNLAENGIKYNKLGGQLKLMLERDENDITLRISDTGVGIPEDALEQIFERFYRVDKARSRKSGGSGLGLSIVKDLVERNSGSIHVHSEPGNGTEFTVCFPAFDTDDPTNK